MATIRAKGVYAVDARGIAESMASGAGFKSSLWVNPEPG
jgi:hypothetical protein